MLLSFVRSARPVSSIFQKSVYAALLSILSIQFTLTHSFAMDLDPAARISKEGRSSDLESKRVAPETAREKAIRTEQKAGDSAQTSTDESKHESKEGSKEESKDARAQYCRSRGVHAGKKIAGVTFGLLLFCSGVGSQLSEGQRSGSTPNSESPESMGPFEFGELDVPVEGTYFSLSADDLQALERADQTVADRVRDNRDKVSRAENKDRQELKEALLALQGAEMDLAYNYEQFFGTLGTSIGTGLQADGFVRLIQLAAQNLRFQRENPVSDPAVNQQALIDIAYNFAFNIEEYIGTGLGSIGIALQAHSYLAQIRKSRMYIDYYRELCSFRAKEVLKKLGANGNGTDPTAPAALDTESEPIQNINWVNVTRHQGFNTTTSIRIQGNSYVNRTRYETPNGRPLYVEKEKFARLEVMPILSGGRGFDGRYAVLGVNRKDSGEQRIDLWKVFQLSADESTLTEVTPGLPSVVYFRR